MDIDVVGGRDVRPIEPASIRGSEIDIKVPITELFPEPMQTETKDPELIEQEQRREKEEIRRRLRLRGVQNAYDIVVDREDVDLKLVYKHYPNSTNLVFRFVEYGRHDVVKNLHLIYQFKQLQKIELINSYDASLEFAKSPMATHLEFDNGRFYNPHHALQFARTIARNKVLQSLIFKNMRLITPEFVRTILDSNSITELIFENSFLDPNVFEDILQSPNLLNLKAPRVALDGWRVRRNEIVLESDWGGASFFRPVQPLTPRLLSAEQWRQIDAHLLENRQRLMVFPVLAAMQLTQSRDKESIVHVLPMISHLLGDPPISRQRAVQMIEQIEPLTQSVGKRKLAPKALPFMF